ncbi:MULTISPECIES: hypothetical protein [Lacticaseibacillus]|uniref:hypothetical protein n=1 Tax=Lacticaseibacillus TaxID=2759736 RepID=UPI0024B1102A|nr:hypothetical protein [Lacticaseibacillus rhamnosus]WHM91199.1 hypothetical protein QJQ50_13460 [Lacticaseibacillus rhamnosus]
MFNLVLQTKDIKEAKRKNGLLEIRFPHPKEKALMLKLRHAVLSIETGWPILPDTTCIGEIVRVLPSKDRVIVAYVRPQNGFQRFVEAY